MDEEGRSSCCSCSPPPRLVVVCLLLLLFYLCGVGVPHIRYPGAGGGCESPGVGAGNRTRVIWESSKSLNCQAIRSTPPPPPPRPVVILKLTGHALHVGPWFLIPERYSKQILVSEEKTKKNKTYLEK